MQWLLRTSGTLMRPMARGFPAGFPTAHDTANARRLGTQQQDDNARASNEMRYTNDRIFFTLLHPVGVSEGLIKGIGEFSASTLPSSFPIAQPLVWLPCLWLPGGF